LINKRPPVTSTYLKANVQGAEEEKYFRRRTHTS
jgi:hypothetical protein